MSDVSALTQLAQYLNLSTHSRHSRAAYLADAKRLLVLAGDIPLQQLSAQQIRAFIRLLRRQGHSARSIARYLAAWRSWYRLLIRQDSRFHHNPVAFIRPPRMAKTLPRILGVDALNHFFNTFPESSLLACRDKALFELAYSCGLRVSELTQLNTNACYNGFVSVLGKGNKYRQVPIGTQAKQALAVWLAKRGQLAKSDEPALFVNRYGQRMSSRAVQLRLQYWSKQHGLEQPLHPHALRHACASHFLQSSQDLRATQELLGHSAISSTQRYTHLDFHALAKSYDAAHPRAKKVKTTTER